MGRPRDPSADSRLLDATRTLLRDVGYHQLTMEAVALKAGVGKPTLYRRWRSKAQLVFELFHHRPLARSMPDSGTFEDDLVAAILELNTTFRRCDHVLFGEQLAAMTEDANFAQSVLDRRIERDIDLLYPIWERALLRGEVDPALDGREVLRDLGSVVMARVMVYHRPFDEHSARMLAQRTAVAVRRRRRSRSTTLTARSGHR